MRAAVILLLLVCAWPSVAGAQDSEEEARRLYARGTELARDQGRCGDAVEYFRRAIAIRETAQRVLSLAACLAATGQHVEAIHTFDRYLGMPGVTADGRAAARRALADERRAVGTLTLNLSRPDAQVFVDGALQAGEGLERALLLDPGSHVLEVRAPGHASARREVSALPGGHVPLVVTLETEQGSAPRIAVEADRTDAEIRIDGEPVGTGRYEGSLSEGRHRIEVRASGYATFGEDVDARFGETVRVNARLGATREENLAESPVLWTIIGVIVVGAAVGIPLGVWAGSPQVDAGNTGIVLMGLEVRH